MSKKCSNPNCEELFPEFYNGRNQCKVCYLAVVKKYQRGIGKNSHDKANKRYREAGKSKKDITLWVKYNRVNTDTLKEQLFEECINCNENLDGNGSQTCSCSNGTESIRLCPVWQEWKHSGKHPLTQCNEYDEMYERYYQEE